MASAAELGIPHFAKTDTVFRVPASGRSAARQRACFGSRKSPVQIRAPRLFFNLTPDVGAFRLLSGSYVQDDSAADYIEGALHLAHVGAMVGICQPSHGGLANTQTAAELHF